MEPGDLLGPEGAGEERRAGPEELRAIVARAGRRRWRTAAGGMLAALVVGGGIGYGLSSQPSPARTVVAVPAIGATTTVPGPHGAAINGSSSTGENTHAGPEIAVPARRLAHLFTRTSGPVTIRGFVATSSFPRGEVLPICGSPGPGLQVEVSTDQMVGVVDAAFGVPDRSVPVNGAQTSLVGVAEGGPVLVVTAGTGDAVSQVRVAFAGGGTDEMAPVRGWVALAAPVTPTAAGSLAGAPGAAAGSPPAVAGTLTALDSTGHVLATVTLHLGVSGPPRESPGAAACPAPCPLTSLAPSSSATVVPGSTSHSPATVCPMEGVKVEPAVTAPLPGRSG